MDTSSSGKGLLLFVLVTVGTFLLFAMISTNNNFAPTLAQAAYPLPPKSTAQPFVKESQAAAYPPPNTQVPPTAVPYSSSSILIVWKKGHRTVLSTTTRQPVSANIKNVSSIIGAYNNVQLGPVHDFPGTNSTSGIIIGNRSIVPNTTVPPHLWVVNLEVKYPNGDSGGCSGWIHSPKGISTAGHCVYDPDRGGWAIEIKATPGRNGPNPPFPFQTCRAVDMWTNNYWLGASGSPGQRPFNDWGGIIVDCSYGQLGNFGFEVSIPPVNQEAIVSGYPCQDIAAQDLGKQFTSRGAVLGVEGFLLGRSRIVKVNADAVGCNSGSPIYKSNGSVFATITQANSDANRGTLVSPEYFDALLNADRRTRIYLPLTRR